MWTCLLVIVRIVSYVDNIEILGYKYPDSLYLENISHIIKQQIIISIYFRRIATLVRG